MSATQPDVSWNAAAASSADWPANQSDDSILHAVVVSFNPSVVALVIELEQLFVPNGTPKPLI